MFVVIFVVVVMMMPLAVVVIVAMIMLVRGHGIGTAFGFEWRLDLEKLRAEGYEQRLDPCIAPEPELALQHLYRHVTVAEMPGEPGEPWKIGSAHLNQRFRLRDDLNQPTFVQHQRIVGAKPHRLGEIEFHASALNAEQEALLSLALGVRQDQRVNDRGVAPLGG